MGAVSEATSVAGGSASPHPLGEETTSARHLTRAPPLGFRFFKRDCPRTQGAKVDIGAYATAPEPGRGAGLRAASGCSRYS
jgi:hypothetical protein